MTQTGKISLPDCFYFPSYSVKHVSHFMLKHFMMSSGLVLMGHDPSVIHNKVLNFDDKMKR